MFIIKDHGIFTSPNTMEYVNINNAKAYEGVSKVIAEFVSPDEIKTTEIVNNKESTYKWIRSK